MGKGVVKDDDEERFPYAFVEGHKSRMGSEEK